MGGDESVIDFSMFGDATCPEEFILNIATSPLSMPPVPVLLHFYSPSKCQDHRYLLEIVFFKLCVIVTGDFCEGHVGLSLQKSPFKIFFFFLAYG